MIVEHSVTQTSCTITDPGTDQWSEFQSQIRSKQLVGWAHSRHQVQLIPQGRQPSQQDVTAHFTIQRQFAPSANLMLILNEAGYTGWTIPHVAMQLIQQEKGDASKVAARLHELVENATFLDVVAELPDSVMVHKHGVSILPGESPPKREQCCALIFVHHFDDVFFLLHFQSMC